LDTILCIVLVIEKEELRQWKIPLKLFLKNIRSMLISAGHEHHLEYEKPKEVSFVQFISGSGSEVTGVTETPYAVFSKKDFGFITFSISEDQMLVQFINSKGEIIYTTTRDKKG
jgi:hypothetical protein